MDASEGSLSGSMTIEMSVIVPVIFAVFFLSVMGIFYFHDKDLISSCAYEAASCGSLMAREKGGADAGEIERLFAERMKGKCILFSDVTAKATVGKEEICVRVDARKGRMRIGVQETAKVTVPEDEIRKIRRLF